MTNLQVLALNIVPNGKGDVIHPVILYNNSQMILVDCGYPGSLQLIEDAVNQEQLSLENLTGIIITHHDLDHNGGLAELKTKYPQAIVYSSLHEKDYINGRKTSLRLQQAEKLYSSLPAEQRPGALLFQQLLRDIQPVPVDYVFSNDEYLPFFEGIHIIHTPGHMPGHISLYDDISKTLIAADAFIYADGELDIANPQFTLDLKAAVKSIIKLQQLDIQKAVCYHGGIVDTDVQGKLKRLVSKYQNT